MPTQTLPSMTTAYPDDKPTPNIPQLLTQKEAAVILRKPPRWLERKRQEGGGPPFRYIGRTPAVYLLEDLLTWIAEQPVIQHTSNGV
ncbi:MAG: helix-turn-helix domain-containing protein [Gammaproteobacteria bacterium]|nr:helix-turn-helix domain-containing protein [Gammaproteobacteria bacterium]